LHCVGQAFRSFTDGVEQHAGGHAVHGDIDHLGADDYSRGWVAVELLSQFEEFFEGIEPPVMIPAPGYRVTAQVFSTSVCFGHASERILESLIPRGASLLTR
jgi:hypothetical protein